MIGAHFEYSKDPWTGEINKEILKDDILFTSICAESDEIDMF
jgi:hypothetical protein